MKWDFYIFLRSTYIVVGYLSRAYMGLILPSSLSLSIKVSPFRAYRSSGVKSLNHGSYKNYLQNKNPSQKKRNYLSYIIFFSKNQKLKHPFLSIKAFLL